jgi:hypothetical protein
MALTIRLILLKRGWGGDILILARAYDPGKKYHYILELDSRK